MLEFFITVLLIYILIVLGSLSLLIVGWVAEILITNTLPVLLELYGRWRYPDEFKD